MDKLKHGCGSKRSMRKSRKNAKILVRKNTIQKRVCKEKVASKRFFYLRNKQRSENRKVAIINLLKNIFFNLKSGKWLEEANIKSQDIKNASSYSLEVHEIEKTFKKNKILKKCSFKIKKGSFHALVGENGAGKTTLIKTIIGGYTKYSGDILYNGLNIKDHPEEKSILTYVPEKAIFPSNMNLIQYLSWISELKGLDKSHSKKLIWKLLKKFDLEDRIKTNPNKLSSGQKKKIFLMQIILEQPQMIILDEPAANLDPINRYVFFEELWRLNKEGKTIIITSHIVAEISKYVNGATFVKKGEIVYSDSINVGELEQKFKEEVIEKNLLAQQGFKYE